jgi:hypothetical protein
MPDRDELIHALVQLDPATLEEVVNTAYRQRSDIEAAGQARLNNQSTPEQFAQWLAHRHLSTDAAIERVVYLPTGAPENEIRLLEVNRFLNSPETESIEPLDFTPEMDLPYRVFVADITSNQWEQIKKNPKDILPPAWELGNNKIFSRG